jgi:preprotein translocase subunit SecY
MIANIKKVWTTEHIRKKIIFTLLMVAVYKLLSAIPVPGINVGLLEVFTEQLRANTQLAFFGSLM